MTTTKNQPKRLKLQSNLLGKQYPKAANLKPLSKRYKGLLKVKATIYMKTDTT